MMFYWTIVEFSAVDTGIWHRSWGILATLRSRCVLIAITRLIVIVGFCAIVIIVVSLTGVGGVLKQTDDEGQREGERD